MTLPICCVTGRIAGDKDACGDCDPCGAAYSVPKAVKALLKERDEWAERYSNAMGELDVRRSAASAEPVAWWCVNYPGGGGALTPFEDVVSHWRSQGLDVVPLYTHPAPDAQPDAEIVAALADSRDAFEAIRLILVNHLSEPERSAFWKAVQARDAAAAALTKAKGGSAPVSESDKLRAARKRIATLEAERESFIAALREADLNE